MEIMYVPPLVEMLAGYFILVAGLTIWAGNDSRLPEIVDGVHTRGAVSATLPGFLAASLVGAATLFVHQLKISMVIWFLLASITISLVFFFIGCAIGRKRYGLA